MKRFYCTILSVFLILMAPAVFAADPAPAPETGIARISWAMKNAGPMPKAMIAGLALTAIMIIITVLYSSLTAKEESKGE